MGSTYVAPVLAPLQAAKEFALAPNRTLQRIGHQIVFLGQALGAIPFTMKHYRREVARLISDVTWGNGSLDPSDIMLPTLRTGGRGNSAGFSNARVDQLLDAAEVELDPAKRKAMYF